MTQTWCTDSLTRKSGRAGWHCCGVTLLQGSTPKAGAALGGGYQAPAAPAEMGWAQTLRVPPRWAKLPDQVLVLLQNIITNDRWQLLVVPMCQASTEAFHICYLIFRATHRGTNVILPILQKRQLKLREGKQLVQVFMAVEIIKPAFKSKSPDLRSRV